MQQLAYESRAFLSTLPVDARERRFAWMVALASAAIFAALVPFAQVPLKPVPAFVPVYQSALITSDLITAALLFGQFGILRSRGLAVLACAYLFSALMAAVHLLSFPGLFSQAGLFGAGPQTTAWLYMFWHGGFPVMVIAYALLKGRGGRASRPARTALGGIAMVGVAALGFALLATGGHDLLPAIMEGNRYTAAMRGTVSTVWALSLLALAVLWQRQPRSVLDLWLMVVMCAWLFDIALAAVLNGGRYDLGFYAGRIYGLLAATFVLIVLLLENGLLYAQLARALDGERTEREKVQERTLQLNELNLQLESRVAARTAQLEAANRDLRQEVAQRARAEEALRKSKAELHEIAAIGATAREQERSRIARELHDELTQALAALKMDLAWLEQRAGADDEVASRIDGMHQLVDGAVAASRRIAADLRPLMLDDLGFVAATEWLVGTFRDRHGVPCRLVVDPPDFDLADPVSSAAYRIIQESLTNIAKHAKASLVDVDVRRLDGAIRLRVRDNGRGFDLASPRQATSFGLVGLRERAHLVGGEIRIDSAPGCGTTIEVSIPALPPAPA